MNEYFFHDDVTPKQMDWLWAHGWRHFGSYFYRYSGTRHRDRPVSVLPLRIDLENFQASRSQRRVLKRNTDLRISFVPAFVDDEVTELFERHKTRFSDNVPASIYTFISERPADLPCTCQSLCLHLDERLIGISYLDIGEGATSSVYQCFDPGLPRRSLGVLMVLLSIERTRALGKPLYYPGYAYAEASHYDYKKNFAGLEAFDWRGGWQRLPRAVPAAVTT